MATVRQAIAASLWRTTTAPNAICSNLGIPPDTENTPHAIAAAVLGMDEATLRRRLEFGEMMDDAGSIPRCFAGRENDPTANLDWHRRFARNALDQWKWWHENYVAVTGDERPRWQIERDARLTRPDQTDGGEG